MKKQNIINLVKYYVDKNDSAFRREVLDIANDFEKNGDTNISNYLMGLISTTSFYKPQTLDSDFEFLYKRENDNKPLYLPEAINNDILGIVRSRSRNFSISKLLFYGSPGTGKTESAFQIARLLERDILSVKMEDLIDSHLGQTSKNIVSLFNEIRHLNSFNVVILFDELDSLVMNRVCSNDLREMGRVTSTFLKELEDLPNRIIIIATTNLIDSFDKALLRRFDAKISFDRYSKEDLIEASTSILQNMLKLSDDAKADTKLFKKILNTANKIPFPGDMIQIIKIALAFSEEESDYLRRIYKEVNEVDNISIQKLKEDGFTVREIESLTGISKSSVSRKVNGDLDE